MKVGSPGTTTIEMVNTVNIPTCPIADTNDQEQTYIPESSISDSIENKGAGIAGLPYASPNFSAPSSTLINATAGLSLPATCRARKVSSASRIRSPRSSSQFLPSTSLMSRFSISGSAVGSSRYPIELGEDWCETQGSTKKTTSSRQSNCVRNDMCHGPTAQLHQDVNTDSSYVSRRSTLSDETVPLYEPNSFHERRRIEAANELLSDLDKLEEVENLLDDEEELQLLRVEVISREDGIEQHQQVSTKVGWSQRNLPILNPLVRLESFQHTKFHLRPKKTVELFDGDFLHITDIILNSTTDEVTLRGIQYHRCNALNGMLERKLNEVCLFYEVDLDDPREPHEQSAIEVSVDKIKTLRNIRRTNQSFPLCRNFAADQFASSAEIAAEGGLTARWKFTSKYLSAEDRWDNRWTERILETFSEEECSSGCGVPDVERRFQWRGQTVMGGSHQPVITGKGFLSPERAESPISNVSGSSEPEIVHIVVNSNIPAPPVEPRSQFSRQPSATTIERSRKRSRTSQPKIPKNLTEVERVFKKACYENRGGVEATRQRMICLQINDTNSCGFQNVIDLESEFSDSDPAKLPSANPKSALALGDKDIISSNCLSLGTPSKRSITSPINVWSSELARPPPAGVIDSCNLSTYGPSIRPAGQMLTFGDAFCGAGGTTRGAVMAGLKVKWGFDFWEHACTTWKTNFSDAACYCMASEEFVSMAQKSSDDSLTGVKVDILHLSPPCQYFSPAHTVDGIDDEMNTASLYAVLEVVKVVKPRVVTLEQTFGILGARCRWYFASLIHMFATLRFSVRWAIVPLSTWVRLDHK
jgi:DNA (cytosine-5)-methyltransferase 1